MTGKGVLLDTCVIIDFLRQKNNREVWFYKLAEEGYKLYISILTHTELYAGKKIWTSKIAKREIEDLLSDINMLPLNQSTSELGGSIRARFDVDLADAVIAATAIGNKLPLATLNRKYFEGIRGLKLTRED